MKKIKLDEFVGQLRPDPKNVEPLAIMQGFVGKSSEENHIRLYTDEALNTFVEIPEDAVVHSETLPKEVSPLGGSKLWVKSDAVLVFGNPNQANRPKTSFLEGSVMSAYNAFGNQQAGGTAQQQLVPTFGTVCETLRTNCDNTICKSYLIFHCPTITRSYNLDCPPYTVPEQGPVENIAGGYSIDQPGCETRLFYCPPKTYKALCPATDIAQQANVAGGITFPYCRTRDYYCPPKSFLEYCPQTNIGVCPDTIAQAAAPQAGAAVTGRTYLQNCRSYDFYCPPQSYLAYCPPQSYFNFCTDTITYAAQATPNAAVGVQQAAITRSRPVTACSFDFGCTQPPCGGQTIFPTVPTTTQTGSFNTDCTFGCTYAPTQNIAAGNTGYYGTFNPYAGR